MTWSYDDTLATDKDKVRFFIGDIDTNDKLISDEGIEAMIEAFGNLYDAAAAIADSIAGQFARSSSLSIDGFSIRSSERANEFRALAASLRRQGQAAAGGLGAPFVGGVSRSEMESVNADTDRVQPAFREGLFDNPALAPETEISE